VLADQSCRLSPDGWGRRVVQTYLNHHADRIVVESNFGGDMATHVIQTAARAMGVTVPVSEVKASRGKQLRAEPIAALFEQSRVHIVGSLAELEDQLVTWVPGNSEASPDRLDALVWALTTLMLGGSEVKFY
jgi:predicted phage terminase large subunit-like protein